jgi:hypothetical protein
MLGMAYPARLHLRDIRRSYSNANGGLAFSPSGSLWRGPSPQQLFQVTPLFFADGQRRSTSKHTIIESRIAGSRVGDDDLRPIRDWFRRAVSNPHEHITTPPPIEVPY